MEVRVKRMSIAAVLTLFVVACSSTPDPTDAAEKALEREKLGAVDVEWDSDARIAHLKGTVESTGEKHRAEEIAESAVGTSGRVLNELTVKGLNDETADDLDGRIRSTLDASVDKDPVLKDRNIDFEVVNGVVTVKGDVRSPAEKTKVSEIVRAAPGVKEMANALEIKPAR
jgi:hyperosmotically inducible periplasmic protein